MTKIYIVTKTNRWTATTETAYYLNKEAAMNEVNEINAKYEEAMTKGKVAHWATIIYEGATMTEVEAKG